MQGTARSRVVAVLLILALSAVGAATQAGAQSGPPPLQLFQRPGAPNAAAAKAPVPLPRHTDRAFVESLITTGARWDGRVVQATPVACYEDRKTPRRLLMRWIPGAADDGAEAAAPRGAEAPPLAPTAGWSFAYEWVEGNTEDVPWKTRLRNAPLEETQYEMYQVNLSHGGKTLGLRLGLRWNNRIYWWQFVRADFLQRGPVYDVLRVGGPIYNEISSIQSDLYLVLYANGVIEAYAHFINHQREGVGTETWGVPVLAFQPPDQPRVDHTLTGTQSRFALGPYTLDLGRSAGYADAERPGSLRTEDGVIVWQPWLDQEIWGELLVEDEGIPEHRIIRRGGVGEDLEGTQRAEADKYWVAKLGENYIPKGMARTVPFYLSLGAAPPEVAEYQAPGWWHAQAGALPTGGLLPVKWWAVPHAIQLANQGYFEPYPRRGPFELGCSSRDSDGTLGAALVMLGNATGDGRYNQQAPLPAYWWADIAVDHVDFTVHEIPKFSWQWIVQPYLRWTGLVYAYWETGDPYLLETAMFAADSYYRFFKTNRPHRFVGRDALGCTGLLALYQTTGQSLYLDRMRDILTYARQSYEQTEDYWPGHQSGVGPNGVARQPDYDYIPMLLARLHAEMLEAAGGSLPPEEEEAAWEFMKFMAAHVDEKGGGGWDIRRTDMSYVVLTALADQFPDEADLWLELLVKWNEETNLPTGHDGGKAYSWMLGALRLDAYAWGAAWRNGTLHLRPREVLLSDPRAPQQASVWTPEGWVTLARQDGRVVVRDVAFPVRIERR